MAEEEIRYLHRDAIDTAKWDLCVKNSANALIYAHTAYLDALVDHWSAIVVGDYTAVMPLPWRRKWGIKYYYHPPFIQQMGLFGKLDETRWPEALGHLFSKINYGDLLFNYGNIAVNAFLPTTSLTNCILDLSKSYEQLSSAYNKDLVNNLKKAGKYSFRYVSGTDVHEATGLFETHYAQKIGGIQAKDFKRFSLLCQRLIAQEMALVRKVINEAGQVASIALLLKDDRRLYNMMNTTTEEGKATAANHFLIDRLIQEFSGRKLVLDLEGSDIEGIRHFYDKFGAVDQPYYLHTRIPVLLQFFRNRKR